MNSIHTLCLKFPSSSSSPVSPFRTQCIRIHNPRGNFPWWLPSSTATPSSPPQLDGCSSLVLTCMARSLCLHVAFLFSWSPSGVSFFRSETKHQVPLRNRCYCWTPRSPKSGEYIPLKAWVLAAYSSEELAWLQTLGLEKFSLQPSPFPCVIHSPSLIVGVSVQPPYC